MYFFGVKFCIMQKIYRHIINILIMQVLSKPIINNVITWSEYFKNKIDLSKFKIAELKEISRKYKLKVSGTKSILINRIDEFFLKEKYATTIQCYLRRYIIQLMVSLKGPALKNRKLCVNDTDFYTLDPIESIGFYNFFSYKDSENFIYGFDINSIGTLLNKPGWNKNPYNRNKFPYIVTKNVCVLGKLRKIFNKKHKSIQSRSPREECALKMKNIRKCNLDTRVQNLFYEIDNLGNYSSIEWLNSLNKLELFTLIKYLWEVWTYRANIPNEVKRKICPYFSPFFDGIDANILNINNPQEPAFHDVKRTCVTIMENMIYTGINNEYKLIASMHILTAFTMISQDARENMPWLYESIYM